MPAPGPTFIGLTGAIASGKSEALAALGCLGAATLSTDALANELIASAEMRDRIIERWGAGVAPGGTVDRERVGAIVFADREELRWLESNLHPMVSQGVVEWRAGLPADAELAVVEVPLLFEAGMEGVFDATLAVVASAERRAQWGDARGTADLGAREAQQLSAEEKSARATFTVSNDGSLEDLEAALRAMWPDLVRGSEDGAR